MPSPPAYQKVNPAASPILFIALTSPTLPLFQLHEYAENIMAQRISMVSGVAQVQVFGAQKYAVRIQLNPLALARGGGLTRSLSRFFQQRNLPGPCGAGEGVRSEAAAIQYRRPVPFDSGGVQDGRQCGSRTWQGVRQRTNDRVAAWFRMTGL
jgi:multidrug efflux pump subunit AcrB